MAKYEVSVQIRWADVDQNRHVRHSAYYDYGATARMMFLNEHGLTTQKMEELKVGPVLFREEAVFRREIRLEDQIGIDIEVLKATADFSRWSLRHNITKVDGTLAAVLQVDGAWIDLTRRKLAGANDFIREVFKAIPLSAEFQWIPEKKP
jgi:acyl-CoA thioester hydrolase